jgi:hypothetical protein
MTEEDAPREVAEQEHLTDFDAVRTSQLDVEGGEIQGMRLDSLLIRDIPLSAWIAMANDPSGLFEGRIQIPEANSALPIMRAHREMHVPADKLPEGPLSVVSAVVPYIADAAVKEKVEWHLAMFRSINQQEAHDNAETIALRWRAFEVDLADSLHTGFATPGILQFIKSVDGQFNSDTRALIAERFQADGRLVIDRPLAAKLEAARRNTLWVAAAVVAENEDVLAQLPPEVADRIRANEQLLQLAQANGYSVQQILELEADNNRTIAQYNVAVGRGCPGVTEDVFEREQEQKAERREEADTLGGKIRCIKCRQFVPKREVVKKTCWECPKCNHKVDICSGKVLREGDAPDPEMVARILQPLAVDGLARRVNQTRPAVREMAEEEMEPALA